MSTCLIISQGEKMYIGADTACSVKTENGYRRFSNNMQKLFTIGNSIFFCSGKKQDVKKCVNWIYNSFNNSIDVMKLEQYLKHNFSITNQDNIFNIEFLLCDYDTHCVTQLSQYNNFKPVKYEKSNQLRIICGGYKTKDSFFIAKDNILSKIPIKDVYNNVFDDIADECVGGNVILFDSPIHFEKMSVNEKNINYANSDNLFLLTSDFVTAGYIYGSQIISGDIYSENYKVDSSGNVIEGSHLALQTGGFSLASGKLTYDPVADKVTLKGITIQWDTSTTPEISDIDGLENSLATTLEKAEEGIQKGLEGINLANSAQSYAESVNSSLSTEITNRINADNKLSTDLTDAYTAYTNSQVSNLDKYVADYLGVGGGTLITEKGVISPYIAGGYLNIANTDNNSRVIIDPNNLTENGYIFQVHDGSEVSVGIKSDGSASFSGHVTAKSLTLGADVSISSNNISGLSSVATSGKYSDLDGTPTIPTSVADLGLDTSTILYKGDITQTTKTDSNGVAYLETSVLSSSGTVTYSTYDADDYIVFGRSKGSDSDGNNYICVSKDGLLTARNALIYGTVYATDGEFTGKIFAEKGGTIAGFNIGDTAIYNGTDSLTSTTSGVYIGTDGIRQYNSDTANVTISNGILTANGADITGSITTDKIKATGGQIANFTILGGYLYNGINIGTANSCGISCGSSLGGSDDYIFWAGNNNFRVDINGGLYSTKGQIAGWEITSSRLRKYDSTSGLYVALCSPTEVGGEGNANADVLVCRTGLGTDASPYDYPFVISSNGTLTATKVNIKGTIKAEVGSTIGGWTLTDGKIYGGTSSTGVAVMQAPSSNIDWVFAAGGTSHSAYKDCPFRVHKDGAMYAESGKIGAWNITDGYLEGIGGSNAIRIFPKGQQYTLSGSTYTFYLVIYDSGGSVPKGGLTVNGWISA